jgi:hypothetical protein
MSHHTIIAKVWADTEEEAEATVVDAMEDSIQSSHNSEGWSYFDSATLINKLELPSKFGVKTFEELETKLIKNRQDTMDSFIAQVKDDLIVKLAPYFLDKREAALYIDTENKELKEHVEKILKKKKDIVKPVTFEDVTNIFVKIVTDIPKDDMTHSMTMYRLNKIKKLQRCTGIADMEDSLQCNVNPFAEFPYDDDIPLTAYYFECIRGN